MQQKLKIAALLLLATLANATAVFGQNIFQKRSDLNYWYDEFTSVFSSDTGFLAIGAGIPLVQIDSNTTIEGGGKTTFTWYDWNGNIVKQKKLSKDSTTYYSMWYGANTFSEDCFYHFGGLDDSATTAFPNSGDILAAKFNYEGDTIWTKRYNSGQFDTGTSGVVASNGDFIGVGVSRLPINGQIHTRAIRYDSLGNIIWDKAYNNIYGNRTEFVTKDNNGNYYLAGYAEINNNGGSNPKNVRAMLLKIDSLGNQIWMKYIHGICDDYSGGVGLATDGNIFLAVSKCFDQPEGNAIYAHYALIKINSNNGDTIWHKEYPIQYNGGFEQPHFLRVLYNGDVLIGGLGLKVYYDNLGNPQSGADGAELIKIDSAGNMIWQRYYIYNEDDVENMAISYISDGKQTPDGGFILVGRTSHFTDFDDGWIIKTDANGCIDLSCVNGVEELDDEDFRLFIYPNPAEEYVSIDLPIMYNKGTLQAYNMQGQLVKSAAITTGGTQSFSISDMPNGIYQLVVYSSNNKLLGREKLVVAR